ncbi:NUDIX domain-containing protein [Lactococcus fujiensis]|uniref:DNA mismatch repair protein MutT n=1 Tax=Lactococcus fujiensis JCM 16395 TaxID=1291764 RepID=A0A2A5RIX8_9LACT|nr:NUDIX hydrolase [Lactococcus fujiensis]PCR99036.1 DNA mismatch repair protein MutT [Lactococcus fujiensis JCM 16395]
MRNEKQYYEQEGTESEFLDWYKSQDLQNYEKPSVTIDNVIFAYQPHLRKLQMLLIKRAAHPFQGKYALPGGFINPNEEAKEAAKRETFEETSIRIEQETQMWQIGAFSTPFRDPRGWTISIAHTTFLYPFVESKASDDAFKAEWVTIVPAALDEEEPCFVNQAGETIHLNDDLAFDHADIIRTTFKRIKEALAYNVDITQVLGPSFTSRQVQELFYVFDSKFDKHYSLSNIVKIYVTRLHLLEKVGQVTIKKQSAGRPKMLLSYKK